ncbi:MAG: peptide ABC transporter substrate-binding protein [Anaerolineae bacterium]|nr:peptide ABC transporter substrate-binding protein [Anaerolineae bacterium]
MGRIVKLNPLLATYNPVDRDITSLIFEGLTASNEYGEIVPRLAESWTVSPDGLQYFFALRQDVLWQDGLPFTADDVVFTFRLLGDPLFPGAESLRAFWRTVEVDALSESLVRFRLTQPLASFPDQVRIGVVPAHVLEGTPVQELGQHPFNLQSPIGTGPYQIEALTASGGQIDGIQLRVAPVFRQRPEGAEGYLIDRLVFRTYDTAEAALAAFSAGEVHSIGDLPPETLEIARQTPGLSLYTTIAPRVGVLIYNWERSAVRFVRNPRVRLALAQAADRAGLVARALDGRAILADSPLLPTSWAYVPGLAWPAYDPAGAKALLDTASLIFEKETPTPEPTATPEEETPSDAGEAAPEGTPAAEDTPSAEEAPDEQATPEAEREEPIRLALTLLTTDDPALVTLAEGIGAGWEGLGFSVSVEAVSAAELRARLQDGDFDAALVEFSFEPNADPDPFVFWHQGQYGTGQNYGGMDDRRISEALEDARRDPVGINRAAHYRRFQELFAERVPALVLYYPLYVYAADARLQGVQLGFMSTASDRFRSLQDWRFEG